jgi:hypothetical protein
MPIMCLDVNDSSLGRTVSLNWCEQYGSRVKIDIFRAL